ncbi:precorrin-6y C5,15-methyltransferase (decarboxylating) subunit CbiE [Rhodopseudomonas sp. P2A-2r]|uniref:precorrin-6y C5,15-methyltransferase (decarboxylating) subunit CbiE n=1 Tax=Rhodopseudomonas sp. P2A-2r TaxID=2991972 RepID=UPI0022345A4F|nr:precorrin-6y C5,15-methyltransferase (decarboxylating) subunit CbiE [Rhodopseudomonas sp. P2A-2r]UZE47537.1 precorrin-6y C5,15-methyltransferase (decarboxylating) subunit CbiE [Rhodopseudomonas sp. P2A-2r]
MKTDAATCTMPRWLSIVGIGEDGIDGLSAVAKRLVAAAELVVGGARHLAMADALIGGRRLAWSSPLDATLQEIARHRGRAVAVLASGDPFHFGIGKQLAAIAGPEEFICLPQPSAYSLAAARLGWSLQEVALVTLHGRALEGVIRYLQPGARILALSWDGTTPARIAALLAARGMGTSRITVLEAMGGPRERLRQARADHFDIDDIAPLNTIAIEVLCAPGAMTLPFAPGLDDSCFENDGQLTKREIRAVTLSALEPRHGELLWDVGLGAGSVAIEWLLRHPSLRAIGIESRADRADRAARNAASLGTPELTIVQGAAPLALQGLAAPDAVFVGGGMGDDGVFEAVWGALKPGGRLVVNAVSLETESRLGDYFRAHGGELVRLQVARADRVGSMYGWRPAMPVTQWRVIKS